MKKIALPFAHFLIPIVTALFFVMAVPVFAQPTPGTQGSATSTGVGGDTQIIFENPLGGSGGVINLSTFIEKVLDVILTLGVPIVALAIIYCGFLFVLAQGNDTKLKAAKEALLWTLVGAALLLGAWVLAQALSGTIQEIAGVS